MLRGSCWNDVYDQSGHQIGDHITDHVGPIAIIFLDEYIAAAADGCDHVSLAEINLTFRQDPLTHDTLSYAFPGHIGHGSGVIPVTSLLKEMEGLVLGRSDGPSLERVLQDTPSNHELNDSLIVGEQIGPMAIEDDRIDLLIVVRDLAAVPRMRLLRLETEQSMRIVVRVCVDAVIPELLGSLVPGVEGGDLGSIHNNGGFHSLLTFSQSFLGVL